VAGMGKDQVSRLCTGLAKQVSAFRERPLEEAESDVLAFSPSPREHWSKARSTNPLERANNLSRLPGRCGSHPDRAATAGQRRLRALGFRQ
jgi:transposase-like protein